MTPNQKRVAVLALVDEFGVSQRRACLVVDQHRSTQCHELIRSSEEMGLRQRIRALAVKYPRDGCRCVHVMTIRGGFAVNRQRVPHLWRLEGLHVQRPKAVNQKLLEFRLLFVVSIQIMCGQSISSSMKPRVDDQSKSRM